MCLPEETTQIDVMQCVFTNNPELGGDDEIDGIWETQKTDVPGYPFDISTHPAIVLDDDTDSLGEANSSASDSDF